MSERPISKLSELMDGEVEARFCQELRKVWDNVYDPNTPAKTAREVTLKIKVVPNERRDSCEFKVNCTSKLAPHTELSQTVMLNLRADGTIVATERTTQIPGQIDIDGNETDMPKTVEFFREAK